MVRTPTVWACPRQGTLRLSRPGGGSGAGDRTYDEIAGLLDGLELIEPGLVYLHEWWPDGPQPAEQDPVMYTLLGAVGRKP